jgi:hypothetical protein
VTFLLLIFRKFKVAGCFGAADAAKLLNTVKASILYTAKVLP